MSDAQRKLGIVPGGGITELTGDVTAGPGTGSQVATIAVAAVTLAKIQDFNTDKLIGRDTAGTGPAEAISVTGGLEFTGGGAIRRSALTGDVSSAAGSTTTSIANNAVTNLKLRDSGAISVIGRSANSSGDPADISAGAGGNAVLRESGSVLGFGTVATGGIANSAITDAKFRDSAALSVVGRSVNSSGNVTDIPTTAASNGVLRENGAGLLGWATIATANITNDAVTNAKLADMATNTFKGNNAVLGNPIDLTASEATSILLVFTDLLKGLVPASGGGTTNFLRADGTFAVPPGSGSGITEITGDMTAGPGSGSQAATIANDAVTFAKMQNLTSDRLMGRDTAGIGDPEEIGLGSGGLEFTGSGEIRIANSAVTNARLANMAAQSIKGNNTGAPAVALDLTVAQTTEMLNVFSAVLKGLVPASGGGSTTFLNADGNFIVPPTTSVKQTEVDFGDVMQVNSDTFHIVDTDVLLTSRIDCWLSGDAPTGKDADDVIAEDPLKFIVVAANGAFNVYIEQPNGALNGTYKIDYVIGTAI